MEFYLPSHVAGVPGDNALEEKSCHGGSKGTTPNPMDQMRSISILYVPEVLQFQFEMSSPLNSSGSSQLPESLNAKTGLFSKRMKIIHKDPILHAQRLAAIKKAKRTDAARMQASEAMKTFFSNPENRLKRSIAMKGVKFFCRRCGDEGHRSHYCPTALKASGELRFKCRLCGERGHNRRTCGRSQSDGEEKAMKRSSFRRCRACGRSGHNRRTCSEVTHAEIDGLRTYSQEDPSSPNRKRTYSCKLCSAKGHNIRTCPERISR